MLQTHIWIALNCGHQIYGDTVWVVQVWEVSWGIGIMVTHGDPLSPIGCAYFFDQSQVPCPSYIKLLCSTLIFDRIWILMFTIVYRWTIDRSSLLSAWLCAFVCFPGTYIWIPYGKIQTSHSTHLPNLTKWKSLRFVPELAATQRSSRSSAQSFQSQGTNAFQLAVVPSATEHVAKAAGTGRSVAFLFLHAFAGTFSRRQSALSAARLLSGPWPPKGDWEVLGPPRALNKLHCMAHVQDIRHHMRIYN